LDKDRYKKATGLTATLFFSPVRTTGKTRYNPNEKSHLFGMAFFNFIISQPKNHALNVMVFLLVFTRSVMFMPAINIPSTWPSRSRKGSSVKLK